MCVRVCVLNICITYIYIYVQFIHTYTHTHTAIKKNMGGSTPFSKHSSSAHSVCLWHPAARRKLAKEVGQVGGARNTILILSGRGPWGWGMGPNVSLSQVFGAHSLRSDLSLGSILEALHRQRSSLRQPNAQPAQEHSCMSTLLYPLSSLQAWLVY